MHKYPHQCSQLYVQLSFERSQIVDAPRFLWRGVLLDCGRHFFPLPFIKKFLDVMALHKLNRFHWHLVEDQACIVFTQLSLGILQ